MKLGADVRNATHLPWFQETRASLEETQQQQQQQWSEALEITGKERDVGERSALCWGRTEIQILGLHELLILNKSTKLLGSVGRTLAIFTTSRPRTYRPTSLSSRNSSLTVSDKAKTWSKPIASSRNAWQYLTTLDL
ncbi:hypothetical protein E2C01_050993 [Portunus trituberculatus]|uniref:Uncharacterized protein n=1 Tax=Portunus trituberculatus TaxID=210409 RepID=A0A5B7GHZ0_PORTR|nr:hypothetical protein [Portunus trituberculatus]